MVPAALQVFETTTDENKVVRVQPCYGQIALS
jgi:hypothetical protein